MKGGQMKSKELIRMAEDAGAIVVRRRGDHHMLKFPDGRVVSIPHGGTQNEVSPAIICKIKRIAQGLRISKY